jgi:hypothetical protein
MSADDTEDTMVYFKTLHRNFPKGLKETTNSYSTACDKANIRTG